MALWRVEVNDDCIAAGSCLGIAPKLFALGDDGRSHPVTAELAPQDAILDAAASCPMEAISIRDVETDRPVDP